MANTLLSYFKDNIKAHGESAKYFNRDFLAKYVTAYNERSRNIEKEIYNEYGTPEYEYNPVFDTDFYKKNSTAYCLFIELWHGYKAAIKYMDCGTSRNEYEKTAVAVADRLHMEREYNRINGYC